MKRVFAKCRFNEVWEMNSENLKTYTQITWSPNLAWAHQRGEVYVQYIYSN